ncbi:alpha/beta hydrolase [Chryseolinea sp. H1M3-3]|uniref:alpha/beta hydrolase n=1 Tax=Chryseolinea sp. H1M3-3 TaxID=3034144 RepID=UPI0023ED2326|nr:alpha/beta hydrolase [Chryseolinea sp. H1M3-3]
MTSKRLIKISFPILLLVGIYFLGPEPDKPKYETVKPTVPDDAAALEKFIADEEAKHNIKPNNEARIVWYDSSKQKTRYAVVYLHGFSASQVEGDPVHRNFAQAFGCNLFLPRLADHGIDTTEALLNFTADRAWESAKEALAVGKKIGENVILMSTSTGGTLALKLAAEYPDEVFALINLSPNIAINDGAAFLLNDPWGLQIARLVMGGDYRVTDANEEHAKYWNKKYRLESLTELEELLESSMNKKLFNKVTQPSLTLYYYKNEAAQDPQVKVSAMLKMHEQLGTPDELKVQKAMPNAGAHVIGSSLTSKDVAGVYQEIEKFAVEKSKMTKVKPANN